MRKGKFKSENNNDKVTHKNKMKMGVASEIKNETLFAKTQKHEKKCYCCGSGRNMLNNFDIKDSIVKYEWFERTGTVHSHKQQAKEK